MALTTSQKYYQRLSTAIYPGDLRQNYLPPGRYVVEIRYQGRRNWDLKRVFLTVKGGAGPSGWLSN